MRQFIATGALVTLSFGAGAQDEFVRICVNQFPNGSTVRWEVTARLFNPAGEIRAVLADVGFHITGFGFSNFTYNEAFNSDFFGPPTAIVTPTDITFFGGNTLPPLNNADGPDSSNPFFVCSFDGPLVDTFTLEGQVTGAYVSAPFDDVYVLQNANGSPGDMPYEIRYCNFPTPGTASFLGMAGTFAARRRR